MSTNINCPICNSNAIKYPDGRDGDSIKCEKCGRYFISGSAKSYIGYDDTKLLLPKFSSWISEQNKIYDIDTPEILNSTFDKITDQKEKTIKEKFNCFMKIIQNLSIGQIISNDFNHCYIYDDIELGLFFQKALDQNYIKGNNKQGMGLIPLIMYGGITFDGLEYIESLAEINKNSKNIFVASAIQTENLKNKTIQKLLNINLIKAFI